MDASLISPSGKILMRRARCDIEPGHDPLAMPVLITHADERRDGDADSTAKLARERRDDVHPPG